MNLYLISQEENTDYDTFDSALVAAPNADVARQIHPEEEWGHEERAELWEEAARTVYTAWASNPSQVKVKLIGKAANGIQEGIIMTSFNAG